MSTTNPLLADAQRYYDERRTMNNPKGWRHVLRVVERAIEAGVYPDATPSQRSEARLELLRRCEVEALPSAAR